MLKTYLILPLTVLLFSCSTLTPESQAFIETSNWQAIGDLDGSEGIPEQSQSNLQALSDEFGGGKVDYKQYQDSYLKAVTVYCKPTNASMLGIRGKPYFHVCDRFPNGIFFYQDWRSASGKHSK